jgi:hypothetical protein
VSQAVPTSTTPTRRSALGFSAAALFAGLTVPTLAADVDPVVALYRRYVAAEAASKTTNEKVYQLRAILRARWGAHGEWKQDPDYRIFKRLLESDSNRACKDCRRLKSLMTRRTTGEGRKLEVRRKGRFSVIAISFQVSLLGESDQRVVDLCDLTEQMIATPATTLAGVRAKMRVGLDLWPEDDAPDWHEETAFAFMTDALRLLDEVAT